MILGPVQALNLIGKRNNLDRQSLLGCVWLACVCTRRWSLSCTGKEEERRLLFGDQIILLLRFFPHLLTSLTSFPFSRS